MEGIIGITGRRGGTVPEVKGVMSLLSGTAHIGDLAVCRDCANSSRAVSFGRIESGDPDNWNVMA